MYPILLFSAVLINIVISNELNHTNQGSEVRQVLTENKNVMGIPLWKQHFWKPPKAKYTHHNTSYIDKEENMIRMPTINPLEDNRKKFIKKSPKRTIQKIIKKKKQKTKRIYVVKLPSTTKYPGTYDKGMDDMSAWKDDLTTLATNQRRKPKKYNSKVARYPMPFQKLQKKKIHKREKRDTFDREDLYILKDFDELKFLKDDKDFSVVQTHVKKYW